MSIMNDHGFTINTGAIAQGIFDMMPEDDRLPLVVGMVPLQWKELVERLIRERIGREYQNRFGYIPYDSALCWATEGGAEDGETYGRFISRVMHHFILDLYGVAKAAGVMVV